MRILREKGGFSCENMPKVKSMFRIKGNEKIGEGKPLQFLALI